MRILPGQPIPFWFKLWDEQASRHVLAHITTASGSEQAGSPYTLTYIQRGIYSGNGPAMGTDFLVVDYETYLDSSFTQLDSAYLPAAEWIEPDVIPRPELIFINPPIQVKIIASKIRASVLSPIDAGAKIQHDQLKGFVFTPKMTGSVTSPQLGDHL